MCVLRGANNCAIHIELSYLYTSYCWNDEKRVNATNESSWMEKKTLTIDAVVCAGLSKSHIIEIMIRIRISRYRCIIMNDIINRCVTVDHIVDTLSVFECSNWWRVQTNVSLSSCNLFRKSDLEPEKFVFYLYKKNTHIQHLITRLLYFCRIK